MHKDDAAVVQHIRNALQGLDRIVDIVPPLCAIADRP